MTKFQELKQSVEDVGFYVDRYSPGGVPPRYKFFAPKQIATIQERGQPVGYFAHDGCFTCSGIADAEIFAAGLVQMYWASLKED